MAFGSPDASAAVIAVEKGTPQQQQNIFQWLVGKQAEEVHYTFEMLPPVGMCACDAFEWAAWFPPPAPTHDIPQWTEKIRTAQNSGTLSTDISVFTLWKKVNWVWEPTNGATSYTVWTDLKFVVTWDVNATWAAEDFNTSWDGCEPTRLQNYKIVAALPVELISFSGYSDPQGVHLNRQTASESNNAWFVVEQSDDGKTRNDQWFVEGNGTTTAPSTYEYTIPLTAITDTNRDWTTYVRIGQKDFDGKMTYADVISIDLPEKENNILEVFPNPCVDKISTNVPDIQGAIIVNIATGQLVNRDEFSGNSFDVSDFPAGPYVINVKDKTGHWFAGKFLKK